MDDVRWLLIEVWGPGDELPVARYRDRDAAEREAATQRMAGYPTEPGDTWGPDYYVREVADD